MFDERSRFRLHHPIGTIPDLVVAPAGRPDEHLAGRIIAAYRRASPVPDAGPVWEPLLHEKQGDLADGLASGSTGRVARDLATLGQSEAAQGFFGGAGQHRKCAADPVFAQLLAAWTYDKLLSLAEAVGAIPLELPETGPWARSIQMPADEIWRRIEARLGHDLTPPRHIGGHLGIRAGGLVLQMRVIEAVYAAYRLHQLTTQHGSGRICEIGAGAGLTAFYAVRFGLTEYTIIDLPTMNAIQGYVLGGSDIGDDLVLPGESGVAKALRILPPDAFAELQPSSIDILFNQDSLPEIEPGAGEAYLRDAARLKIPLFLSINQEARLPTDGGHQRSVPELVAATDVYRSRSRHRHWLRQGYLEEMFDLVAGGRPT